jgi:hypothetical protein
LRTAELYATTGNWQSNNYGGLIRSSTRSDPVAPTSVKSPESIARQ